MPRLIVIRGVDEGKQFDLTAPTVGVGRHSSNVVALHDTQISRRHLELRALPAGGYQAVDLGSGNGTLVNGQPVQVAALRSGDYITAGQSVMMYTADRLAPAGGPGDMTERVRLVGQSTPGDLPSAIIRTVAATAGSQILARPELAATDWLRTRLANLAALYETTEAVSHILDPDELLDRVMGLVFKSVDADHGCFVLRDAKGNLTPKAVRYKDGLNRQQEIGLSRTVVDHVFKENHGVLLTDTTNDARFSSESMHRNNIREVICVPMSGRRETVGVLFLDVQSTLKQVVAAGGNTGRFNEDHLHLASAIAHQAAIAVEESRYHEALVNAERLAAVGQTIAALSHHIKNIMQGVRFGGDMVRAAMTDGDKELLAKGWRLVEKNQTKIDELILDMLSYSKDREPVIEPTDLNRLCEDVLDVVRGRAKDKGVTLDWRPGQGVGAVPCDPDGMHRAVLNIASNAIDAVEGRVGPKVAVQTLVEPDGAWARVVVLDNGPGIPADIVDDIFEPFVSTKGARGTGLGLPVSRKILREHGGDILVQSVAEKGSKFVLRLPMKSAFGGDPLGSSGTIPVLRPPESD